MKKIKRLIVCILAVLLMFTSIPTTGITTSSEKSTDFTVTNNDESTNFTVTNNEETEELEAMIYAVASNSNIVLPSSAQMTRAEWLHNLVVVFDMTVESESLPDNYFADLTTSHKYYMDILLAVEFGVVNVEAGSDLHPDDGATREFAVSTLNFCLGYQLGEETTYTFTDVEDCADPDSVQIALERGWVESIDGCFLPDTYITTAEAKIMLDDAEAVLQEQIVDESYESTYEFAEGVIVIPDGTIVEEDEEGIIYITDCPETILVDDVFAVYFGGIPSVYKAVNVLYEDNITIIEVETVEADDAFSVVDAEGVLGTDAMEIVAADGVDVTFEEDASAISTYGTKKVRNITSEVPLSFNGITGKVSVKIKNPYVEYSVDSGRAYVALCGQTEISYGIYANLAEVAGMSKGLTLFTCNIAGVGSFDITINVNFSGSATGNVKGWLVAGVECEKGSAIRAVKSFTQQEYYTNVEAETSVSLKASLGVTKMPIISAYVYAEVGVKANFSKKTYVDASSPHQCTHFAAYLFARYGASASAKFGVWKTSESLTYTIYDESNSPVRIVNHYEDGQLVAKCTRGTSYANFFTKSSSRWSGCGWISANGAYGLNEDGSYYPLYNYTLDENNQATITKYNGNSWSVYIPKEIDGYTVVAVGSGAFQSKSVRHVVIPDTVTRIASGAYKYCYYLRDITIPDSVIEIGSQAFYSCSSLTDVTIPDGVIEIGSQAFYSCSSLTDVTIPDGVIEIGSQAFYSCSLLTNITIPDSVTKINGYAFSECVSLRNVKLSKSLTYLGQCAFGQTAIEAIEIPKSLDQCNTVGAFAYKFNDTTYYISAGPFYDCPNLRTVTFEKGTTQVAQYLLCGSTFLENINIPDTVTTIEGGAFQYCLSLNSVTIGDAVTTIGGYAFSECVSLRNVKLSKSLTYLGQCAFGQTAIEAIEIPKSLDQCDATGTFAYKFNDTTYYISAGPFYDCPNLKTVTFEKGTTQVGRYLLGGSTFLENIDIPDTVTTIENGAFQDCLSLNSVTIGDAVTTIEGYAFAGCVALPNITIPDSVTKINGYAFSECVSLRNVKFSKSLTYLGQCAFGQTAIEAIEIPKSLDQCDATGTFTYKFNDTTYYISAGPFYDCPNLRTVTFEKGTTQVARYLLCGSAFLENINIPDTVITIEYGAFQDCLSLNSVTIGDAVTTIEGYAFAGCVTLPKVIIPSSVTVLDGGAFQECASLQTIEIPDSVITMGSYIFDGCTSLESVKLPNKRVNIMGYMFRNCSSLKTIEFPETVETIQSYAFYGCTALESFTFAGESPSLKTIQDYAFYNCSSLKEAILPEKVNAIGAWAFQNCLALEKVYIPQSTKTLGSYVFKGCETLSDVTIADYSITTINAQAFMDCPDLQKIVLPKGLTTIGSKAFMNATSLGEARIPESVTSIDSTAFSYPEKMKIVGKGSSYAETFATKNGFKFVDDSVPSQGISLIDGIDYIVMDAGETYRAIFEYYPEETTDVIALAANNSRVTINGHDIYAHSSGDTIITATASSGVSYNFTVHIRSVKNISIPTQPNKLSYIMGEELDLTGMVVQVNYYDNSTREITDYTVSEFDSSVEGHHTVTVSWISAGGSKYTTTFTVEIIDPRPKLTGIVVDTMPVKREYARKESLDLTGLVIKANYTDGSSVEVTDYTVSGYNALQNGIQTVTITYNDFTTTFTVAVGQALIILGDVNGDEVIDAGDAVLISMYDAGLVALTADQISACDVNRDGVADAGDAVLISMYDAGLITEF